MQSNYSVLGMPAHKNSNNTYVNAALIAKFRAKNAQTSLLQICVHVCV